MHVASTTLFEGPAPPYVEFRDHIDSRLHLVPRFRQKLRFVPFGQGRPVWVDDPHLNLAYHVRHTSLPAPGCEQQLRVAGRPHLLPAPRPLEAALGAVAGRGPRRATASRSSARPITAMVDGVSGVDITTVLFDMDQRAGASRRRPPERWIPEPEPSGAELLGGGAGRARDQPARDRSRRPAPAARPRAARAGHGDRAAVAAGTFAWAGLAAPETPFNVEIGPHRRFAWVRASPRRPEARSRTSSAAPSTTSSSPPSPGPSAATCARTGTPPTDLELRAMVPVSVRSRGRARRARQPRLLDDGPAAGLVRGPGRAAAARQRQSMGDLKESKQAMGATADDPARPTSHRRRSPARRRACSRASASSTSSSPTSRARSSRST